MHRRVSTRLPLLLCLFGVAACAEEDDGATDFERLAPTLANVQREVFQKSCAGSGCHVNADSSALPSWERDAGLRDRLLGPSTQLATMPYITPGDPLESYLWHKLSGTQIEVGGAGGRMPKIGEPLPDDALAFVERWILAGAPE